MAFVMSHDDKTYIVKLKSGSVSISQASCLKSRDYDFVEASNVIGIFNNRENGCVVVSKTSTLSINMPGVRYSEDLIFYPLGMNDTKYANQIKEAFEYVDVFSCAEDKHTRYACNSFIIASIPYIPRWYIGHVAEEPGKTIVARIHPNSLGTRYLTVGYLENGYVANEYIVSVFMNNRCMTFIRGAMPCSYIRDGHLIKNKIKLRSWIGDSTNYWDNLPFPKEQILAINLIEDGNPGSNVAKMYSKSCLDSGVELISSGVDGIIDNPAVITKIKNGSILRINCLDSCDRTSRIEPFIISNFFNVAPETLYYVWTQYADKISRLYTGTSFLRGDETISDTFKSIARIYNQCFSDEKKNTILRRLWDLV